MALASPSQPAISKNATGRSALEALIPEQIPPLLGASRSQLTTWVQQQQQPAYRGQQLHQWIYQKGVRSLEQITVFPKQWRAEVAAIPIGRSQLHHRVPWHSGWHHQVFVAIERWTDH